MRWRKVDEHMKAGKSVVMVDNTTFASAGRSIYYGNKTTEGGRHAEEYYSRNLDALSLDRQGLAEFLTALILFDVLVWDGSSCVQELKGMGDAVLNDAWVYNWFPQFEYAHKEGIIEDICADGAGNRLGRARLLSMQWVKEHFSELTSKLPMGFRIPLVYSSERYHDRREFISLNEKYNLNLQGEQLALAMFLHRGMFYQSRVFSEDGWSYLPHSHRAYLLSLPEIISMSIMCDDDSYFDLREPITGTDILKIIDEHFQRELRNAMKVKPIPVGAALGASFMQIHYEAYRAFSEALSFRESAYGQRIREQFRELINLGNVSNRQGIENRVREIDQSLQNEARSHFGAAWAPDPSTTYAINFFGSFKYIVEPLLSYLPAHFREGATKFLHRQFYRNGFQILFRHYFQRR